MAIEMVDVKGKKCPQINLSKCIFCYKCIEDCPRGALKNSTNFELATTNKSSLVIKPQRDKQLPKKSKNI
jgi:hydrogenase-4 component H